MNRPVYEAKERRAGDDSVLDQADGAKDGHHSVVVEVQHGGRVGVKTLLQHQKDRIKEVEELGHPVPPGHIQFIAGLGAGVAVVGVLPVDETAAVVAVKENEVDEEGVTGGHADVVDEHDRLEEVGRDWGSIGHHPRAQTKDKVQVEGHDGHHGPGPMADEKEVGGSRILDVLPVLPERVACSKRKKR